MVFTTSTSYIDQAYAWVLHQWQELNYYLQHNIHPTTPLLLYAVVAGIIGFIVKRYMQSLINSVVLAVLFVCCAHYFGIVTINLIKINHLFGFSSHYSLQSYSNVILAWIRGNTLISVCSAGGFFIGYSLA